MIGDKYILEPEAILDHSVAAEGKRWYLVKWKPKWVKKHELPNGVYDKWIHKKNNPEYVETEEDKTGFFIMEERKIQPGDKEGSEGENGEGSNAEEEEDEDEELDEDEEEDEDEELDEDEEEGEEDEEEEEGEEEEGEEEEEEAMYEDVEVKEEPIEEEDDESGDVQEVTAGGDPLVNGVPPEIKEEDIKEEERISIPSEYQKPYS